MKKVLALVLCVILAMGLVGCGTKESKEDVLKEAMGTSGKLEEFAASFDFKATITANSGGSEQSVDFNLKGSMEALADKLKLKVAGGSMGQENKLEAYFVQEENMIKVYSLENEAWTKKSVSVTSEEQAQKLVTLFSSTLFGDLSTFTDLPDETIDGTECYVYEGTITKAMLGKIIGELKSELASELDSLGTQNIKGIMKAVESIPNFKYTVAIDKEKKIVKKVECSLAKVLSSIVGSMLGYAGSSDSAGKYKVSKCDFSFVIDKTSGVDNFEVPAEAKKAESSTEE